jgi:SAM-dependent methyltransferase
MRLCLRGRVGIVLRVMTAIAWTLPAGLHALAAESGSSNPLAGEQALPERYTHVVQDALRLCQPRPGFWVDLGAGKGQVALALIEATDNPVVMVDPKGDAMTEGLQTAREKGLERRLAAVVGFAEALPFPDNTVDLVVSRGSIFFWDDPVKGLREVQRVLRPGGKAYIGGGAGSSYPKSAVAQLIQGRQDKLQGDGAEKWKRFIELRRPEQMKEWASKAGLSAYRVLGQGAVADDAEIGQGVWLLFEKQPPTE